MSATYNGRQAIVTKYLGPTNFRGSRVKATCEAGSITVPWNHGLNTGCNHAEACDALLAKLGWTGEFMGSSVGTGFVFVYYRDSKLPGTETNRPGIAFHGAPALGGAQS